MGKSHEINESRRKPTCAVNNGGFVGRSPNLAGTMVGPRGVVPSTLAQTLHRSPSFARNAKPSAPSSSRGRSDPTRSRARGETHGYVSKANVDIGDVVSPGFSSNSPPNSMPKAAKGGSGLPAQLAVRKPSRMTRRRAVGPPTRSERGRRGRKTPKRTVTAGPPSPAPRELVAKKVTISRRGSCTASPAEATLDEVRQGHGRGHAVAGRPSMRRPNSTSSPPKPRSTSPKPSTIGSRRCMSTRPSAPRSTAWSRGA